LFGVAVFGPDPITTFPAGDVVWTGGEGCTTGAIPPADTSDPDPQIALIQRGTCFFSTKATNAELQGYDAYIVANHTRGGDGLLNMAAGTAGPWNIPGIFIGNSDGETLKTPGSTVIALNPAPFDGYGFMRVLDVSDPENIVQIGTFATENIFNPAIEGDRTAHNVIVDGDRAYWSWCLEGMRVVDFSDCQAGDGFNGCTTSEVAHFTTADANFWGVYLHEVDGETYILGSDRNSGLYIFANP
jgi:hypothetical protein